MIVLTVAACSDDGAPRPSSSSGPVTGPLVEGHFTLTGGVDLSGDFTVLYPLADDRLNRCDRIASGATGYVIPTPTIAGDARLSWIAAVRAFHGAGTYQLADAQPMSVEITAAPGAVPLHFTASATSSMKLIVEQNNSGKLEFSGFAADGVSPLSGSLSWACH